MSRLICGLLLLAGFALLVGCGIPPLSEPSAVPLDTSFSIADIQFPNDTIYQRALINTGSLWRLEGFISKCKTLKTVRIGFIGGSITAGALASRPDLRYSSLFCALVKNRFSNLENVVEINAGIGATTSRFGCSRIQQDLLLYSPDLIVVEFAVNDCILGDDLFVKSCIEGLVRQCFAYDNKIPVLLLFMPGEHGGNVQNLHIDVGNYYNLPMISDRDAIWPLIDSNRVSQDVFYADIIHPNDNGHRVCANLLYSFVEKQIDVVPSDQESDMPAYKYSDSYQYAGLHDTLDTLMEIQRSGWNPLVREKGRLAYESFSSSANSVMTIQSNCREITLGIHMQQADTSSIRVTVDDVSDTTLNNCFTMGFTKFIRVLNSPNNNLHVVRVEHSKELPGFVVDNVLYAGRPISP
jgi:lysophospholipase L1-like esterase